MTSRQPRPSSGVGTDLSEGFVTSSDGTRIGYLSTGRGPGLVLVQGAMGTYNYRDLAQLLAPHFTVYTPDRRGRGMSPKPYDRGHDIARDVEDLDALLDQTRTDRVFSSIRKAPLNAASSQVCHEPRSVGVPVGFGS